MVVGPSMHHYRCVQCFMPTASKVRDVDTVECLPTTIPFPSVSTEDYLGQAAGDILSILSSQPTALPSLSYGDTTKNALVQIAYLLGRATSPPPIPVNPPKGSDPRPTSEGARTNPKRGPDPENQKQGPDPCAHREGPDPCASSEGADKHGGDFGFGSGGHDIAENETGAVDGSI
jgi:hypothetical protein